MELKELRERQNWKLQQKIYHTIETIDTFIERTGGLDHVYISFSGGKDSTILLHLANTIFKDIKAMFIQTGNEFPDICRFVREMKRTGYNIDIVRPTHTPKEVWQIYGFPIGSKIIAENIHSIRINPNTIKSQKALGIINKDSIFCLTDKWKYLIQEKYETSNKCCDILKKRPAHQYQRRTGRNPIIATMAEESILRERTYLKNGGCNVFRENDISTSLPLSIWTEKDIWEYIEKYNVKIADIYRKGAKRTGCMGCGFGAQFKQDNRFELLYELYPKCYKMIMNYTNKGIPFEIAIRKMMHINGKTMPNENKQLSFNFE